MPRLVPLLWKNRGLSTGTSVVALLLLWFGMSALSRPLGEFPWNDDWAYAYSVRALLENGDFQLSDWTAVNLLPQTLWGAAACLPTGFSFTALRVSTLLLGAAGVLATFQLLVEAGADKGVSTVSALCVAVNPVYFFVAHSFNSDVPSYALMTGALLLMARSLARTTPGSMVPALGLAALAVLNRQSGLVLFPVLSVAWLYRQSWARSAWLRATLVTAMGLAVQLAYSAWLSASGRKPFLYGVQADRLLQTWRAGPATLFSTYVDNLVVMSTYLGVFLLPIVIMSSAGSGRLSGSRIRNAFLLAVAGFAVLGQRRMPLAGNVLELSGLGPQGLDGFSASLGTEYVWMAKACWSLLTVLGLVSAGLLAQDLIQLSLELRDSEVPAIRKSLSALGAGGLALCFAGLGGLPPQLWYDRYLLQLLPFGLLVSVLSRLRQGPSGQAEPSVGRLALSGLGVVAVFAAFSVAGTRDAFAANRARWQALSDLVATPGVQPELIQGGFEYRGWRFANRIDLCHPGRDRDAVADWSEFGCLSQGDWTHELAFQPPAGRQVQSVYSFERWWPPRTQSLFVLRSSLPASRLDPGF